MSDTATKQPFIISAAEAGIDSTDNEKAFIFWKEKLTRLPVLSPTCVTATFRYKTKDDPTKTAEYTTSKIGGVFIAEQDLNSDIVKERKSSALYLYIGGEDVDRFYPDEVSIRDGDGIGVPFLKTPPRAYIAVLFPDMISVSVV